MEKGQRLKAYSADLLATGDIVAVETNISSYEIPAKGDSTGTPCHCVRSSFSATINLFVSMPVQSGREMS